ncbi:MAG: TetR/AcrR family transcriptional regulator [Aeromicrobium sp.]|jgi:AcrR family transcriptional regulator|uniref:TetR/AcrR family transcriptional regulator n=1 Tax=Aeromicrobium sp. TaxID=1871063 RepID=UPI00261A0B83|nr:TetR/AcrR family transcriptional regulator [Aeromicrobium sp.]MCW2788454.1 TetR/AcrR family transcriptional regulator [Aeromicrobium sp.]MCW2823818.1 TetR/AcrR family transcriptional regulator [Aeromicrobium sp.]
MNKKEELAEAATDHALEHGLIGLSLRPLAAAIGTSDRMLIYHFGSKDELVAAVLATSNERSIAIIQALPPSPSVHQAVVDLWAAFGDPQLQRCQRMYVEAAALGLFGREPYATSVVDSNNGWMAAMTAHLHASGADEEQAPAMAAVVDATFNGLMLDRPLEGDEVPRQIVEDLAAALAHTAGHGSA